MAGLSTEETEVILLATFAFSGKKFTVGSKVLGIWLVLLGGG
jgi:hypothetical protein